MSAAGTPWPVTSATRMPSRAHREIASGDLQASDVGHCARENRGLDLARDFELFVDGEQAMLIGEGAVGGHIAKAADEKQESENFVAWSAVPQTKAGEIAVEHKCTKDYKTKGEEAVFPGPRLSQAARPETKRWLSDRQRWREQDSYLRKM